MSDRSYNGWSNYETWLFNIWGDEHGWMPMWVEDAQNIYDESEPEYLTRRDGTRYELFSKERVAKSKIAEYLKDHLDGQIMDIDTSSKPRMSDGHHGFLFDLLKAAIDRVDCQEMADHVFDALDVCEQ